MSNAPNSPQKSPENVLGKRQSAQQAAANKAKPTDSGADLPHNSKKEPLGPNTKR